MKKYIFLFCLINFAFSIKASKIVFPLIFNNGQVELSISQKNKLDSLAKSIANQTDLTILPLVYDPVYQRNMYDKNAKLQAVEIVNYMKKPGFDYKGTACNVPSTYRGLSVQVIFKYNTPKSKNPFPEKPSQFFIINPLKDTVIIGNEGTKLFLKPGCLTSKNEVILELKEYYSFGDYIKAELPTTSNGKMIQSGGVIYLDIKENNPQKKSVNINPSKGIDVDFTKDENDTNMQIFIKDPNSSEMNWILPKKNTSKSTWQMTEERYDYTTKKFITKTYNSKEEWESHLNDIKKEEQRIETEKKAEEESNRLLNVSNLGFINCDRFPSEELYPFSFEIENTNAANYYLVFTDIKGVMKGNRVENQIYFPSLPKNKNVLLVVMAFEDEKSYYYETKTSTKSNLKIKFELQEVTKDYINNRLQIIN